MQYVTCHRGLLRTLSDRATAGGEPPLSAFTTGLADLDALAPPGGFARGAVHEALADPGRGPLPRSFALLLARAAVSDAVAGGGTIVWSDPAGDLYPPAMAAGGLDLTRLLVLRPPDARAEAWAIGECLRCPGVSVVIAAPPKLTRVEARRLQLAAERGGGVGLLLRPWGGRGSEHYAAVTRWLVNPAPGDAAAQRWDVQLVHGRGGRVGSSVVLEVCRETNVVRAVEQLADRPAATAAGPRRVAG